MKQLVEFIARSLVDHPDRVVVEETTAERGATLELSVAPEDLGKVIGKQGRTARAIRTILSAAALKASQRVVLEILE